VFKDTPYWKILFRLGQVAAQGYLHVVGDAKGITGMIIAYPHNDTLEIEQLVCSDAETFRSFRKACAHVYSGMDLSYFRNGKRKTLAARRI